MSVAEELKDIVKNGLVPDIFKIEQAYYLHLVIGQNSEILNKGSNGNFGELFGAIQHALVTETVLAAARVYDNQSKMYRTRCMKRALDLMDTKDNDLPDILELHNTKLALHFLPKNSPVLEAVYQGKDVFIASLVQTVLIRLAPNRTRRSGSCFFTATRHPTYRAVG